MTQTQTQTPIGAKLEFEVTVSEDGVLQLSPELLKQIGVKAGEKLLLHTDEGSLILTSVRQRRRQVQQRVLEYMGAHGLETPSTTGAERIRAMRDEDAAIEAQRGR